MSTKMMGSACTTCSTMAVILCIIGLVIIAVLQGKPKPDKLTYYAVLKNGRRINTGVEYIVVPLREPNDVNDIWPEFVLEKEIDSLWGPLTLRSEPLIFSENPAIQGKYGRRMVYYVKRK